MTAPAAAPRLDDEARAELEEQRDFLLRSLDDLERERAAGDLDDADYQTLKDDYTARAAKVLAAVDQGRAAPTGAAPARTRRGRRLLSVVVVTVVAVSAGLAVAASSGARMPGDTISGDIRQTSSGQLQQAAALAQQGDFTAALKLYDGVLSADPVNLEALSERGLLLVSLGSATKRPALADQGQASIERALEVDARNPRALFYLGLALRLKGDDAGAAEAFDRSLAADPPPALRQAIESFLASVATPDPGAPPG
ncbi:MAG: tetratricopeptide repeat protein [Acidimicrobiales bacterium]